MFVPPLAQARRYQHILAVLARYGLAGFMYETGLDELVGRAFKRRRRSAEARLSSMSRPERIRRAMEDLGPTFMKLGQVLSTRRDLVPEEYADEFARLQADCPAVPWPAMRERLDEEFAGRTDELFSSIDASPLAAGTMAQAHAATLADGTPVVLKILRPGISTEVEADLQALGFLADRVEDHFTNLGFSPRAVLNEFARQMRRELNLLIEARSTERLRAAFEDDPEVNLPRVYWDSTTKGVLTLEHIRGELLAKSTSADFPPEIRRRVVEAGSRAVLRMCLEIGFFHADPHPGNIFVLEGGRICLIDLGMTGSVTVETRYHIADLVLGVVRGDAGMVLRAAIAIGRVDTAEIDRRSFENETQELVDSFIGVPLERIDLAAVLQQFFDMLRRAHVRCPPDVVLLIKALSTIQGVGARLDPTFDLVGYASPFVERLVRERYSPTSIMDRLRESVVAYGHAIEHLPGDLADILGRVRENRLGLRLDVAGLDEFSEEVSRASGKVAYALLIASVLLSSSILVLAGRGGNSWAPLHLLGSAGFIISFVLAMLLLWRNFRADRAAKRRHRRRHQR